MPYRLPLVIERELAKFLCTIGLKEYGSALWNLIASRSDRSKSGDRPLSPSPALLHQLQDQARHDPSVTAAGSLAVPNLRCRMRHLRTSHGVSGAELLSGVEVPPSALFIVDEVDSVTIEQIKTLIAALRSVGAVAFAVLVTDQHEVDSPKIGGLGFTDTQMIFWRDRFHPDGDDAATVLAMFVHIVGAPTIIVLKGHQGIDMLGRFGRPLSSSHSFYVLLESDEGSAEPITGIYDVRTTAPYAMLLTRTQREADALRSFATGIEGPGVAVLGDDPAKTFGAQFQDLRTQASQTAISYLLRSKDVELPVQIVSHSQSYNFEITVTIVFHRERELVLPSLASLRDMVEVAKAQGITVEVRAMIDNPDNVTLDILNHHGQFLDEVRIVSFGNAAKTRNAGIDLAQGRFLVFLDGDDLWSANWLLLSYRAAIAKGVREPVIWHAEAQFSFWASDCRRRSKTAMPNVAAHSNFLYLTSSDSTDFEPRDILMANQWNPTNLALREIYCRFPYRPDDWSRQIGIEDWRWNLETMGHGIAHLVVPDTLHLIRIKEGGSLGQLQNASGLLPILS